MKQRFIHSCSECGCNDDTGVVDYNPSDGGAPVFDGAGKQIPVNPECTNHQCASCHGGRGIVRPLHIRIYGE